MGIPERYGCFIWACSTWGHRLPRSALEQLVPAAVDSICCADSSGRGGANQLVEALTRQVRSSGNGNGGSGFGSTKELSTTTSHLLAPLQGFNVGPNCPAATAALKRLLPLVYANIDLTSRLEWEVGTGVCAYVPLSHQDTSAAFHLRLSPPSLRRRELSATLQVWRAR